MILHRVLLISDMHTASFYGLIPKNAKTEGARIIPNKHQKQLQDAWVDMCNKCGKIDLVIANGDLIDGPQHMEMGKYVASTDLAQQCRWAAELLDMIPCKKYYLTKGTEYHSVKGVPAEEYIAEILRGEYANEVTYRPELKVKVDWATIVANHTIGVSTSWYRATAIARDLLLYELNKEEYGSIDLVVRSHAHYFVLVEFGSKVGVVTPCWQIRTPFATKKNLVAPTKIGYLVAEIGDKESKTIDIRKKFYKIGPLLEEDVYEVD